MVKPLDRDVRFGRRLKQRRNDAGLKQVDLVSRLNRPQAYVSKYESGKRRLYFFEFVEIAEAIGFDPVGFLKDFLASDDETGVQEGGSDGACAGVPTRHQLSRQPALGVPSRANEDDGTGAETYVNQSGRRRRRRLASPAERRARDDRAREMHHLGSSYRDIAQRLRCGKGTVERAVQAAPPPNRTISGVRRDGRAHVMIDGRPLDWQEPADVGQLSPTGPEWGFRGSGPNQLALAILLTVTGEYESWGQYRHFVEGCIGRIDQARDWTLKTDDVHVWLLQAREIKDKTQDEPVAVLLDVMYVSGRAS